jgi:hypothetical protein
MREQIEMQRIVIQDLEGKLGDSHALIEKLQVCDELYLTPSLSPPKLAPDASPGGPSARTSKK